MKDRGGNAYQLHRYVDGKIVRQEILSPARQAKKATGLKGRQWVKHQKAARRALRGRGAR